MGRTPMLPEPKDLGAALVRLLARPAIASKASVGREDHGCRSAFRTTGDVILLVGTIQGEVGGSEYLAAELGQEAGRPPALDLDREKAVQETVRRAVREGLLSSAHDCSAGGLAVALAECCMMHDAPAGAEAPWVGAAVRIPFPTRKDFVLFGEDPSRIVVSLPNANVARLEAIAKECGAPVIRLGAVGGDRLEIQAALSVPVADLGEAWRDGSGVLRRDAARASPHNPE